MTETSAPKALISYSWTTLEYEEWVLNIATELREAGVDVILDKWDLREGDDANAFMERMVTDESVKKVLILSDRRYAEKADGRRGGVGIETQIISAEVYRSVQQSKFVVAITERDEKGKAFVPTYYTSRIYIDFSSDELYASNFEKLLRWIYGKPLYQKPELGNPPSFLEDNDSISLGTNTVFRRAIDSVKNSKSYAFGATTEYLETFTTNIEKFRLEPGKLNIDYSDIFLENIKDFLPYRNQIIELIATTSRYNNIDISFLLHKFFESLLPYMRKSSRNIDFDNYKFIIQEMFLYCIAILLKNECFQEVCDLVQQRYFIKDDSINLTNTVVSFNIFSNYLESLERRNERMQLMRLSIHSDLLKDRCIGTGIDFIYLMQADFVLFIADAWQSLNYKSYQGWNPQTLLYLDYEKTFEIFFRGESKSYFDKFKCIFNVENKEDFLILFDAFKQKKAHIPKWNFTSFDPIFLMGYENLCTRK